MKRVTFFSISLLLAMSVFIFSCESGKKEVKEQSGEELVNQLWNILQESDVEAAESFMAEGFQAVHEDGANNKEQEIQLISELNIHSYTITNLVTTQHDKVIVATYMVSVEETVEGERLSKSPAARMSVFVEVDGTWKWISHANLKPLEQVVEDSEITQAESIQ
ncbi:MAG TPA: nuclear transport factor 2 family protein [Bacteroidales bacterium]|nr:nuclear transport factor 2 family protein [Bacteroidales bacterium]